MASAWMRRYQKFWRHSLNWKIWKPSGRKAVTKYFCCQKDYVDTYNLSHIWSKEVFIFIFSLTLRSGRWYGEGLQKPKHILLSLLKLSEKLELGFFAPNYSSAQIQVQSASPHMGIKHRNWIHLSLWWMLRNYNPGFYVCANFMYGWKVNL